MRILQTPARFYPYTGGVENTVYCLSKELVKAGNEVTVICADEPHAGSGVVDGINVKRLGYAGKIANTNITLGLPAHCLMERFDVIHTHLPCPWSADISCFFSAIKRRPLFLTYHNDITGSGGNRFIASLYNRFCLKLLLARAAKIFIANERNLERWQVLAPWKNKVRVLPFGVDTDRFKPLDAAPPVSGKGSVFFLSILDRFHDYKGLEHLLQAMRLVRQSHDVTLYIGGSGPLLQAYRRMAEDAGLGDSVVFLGFIRDEELPLWYNRCDVFVLPSISAVQEGWGLVAAEAMACGKPVITTSVVGMAEEIVRSAAGLVVPQENSRALADAVCHMFEHADERRVMGGNALRVIRNRFNWKMYASAVIDEYRKAVP